jgi:hypothetical protein
MTTALHVADNSVAQLYRRNQFTLVMSGYAFELLIGFLQETETLFFLLRLVNRFLNIRGSSVCLIRYGFL